MKKIAIATSLSVALLLGACSDTEEAQDAKSEQSELQTEKTLVEQEKENKEATAQKEVVEAFLATVYYKEGNYADYQALYAEPEQANTEEEFEAARQSLKVEDEFPEDTQSVDRLARHLVAVSTGENTGEVYWVEDINKDTKADAAYVWSLTNVNGVWKLK